MNCKYLRENLYEYLDGSLSASERAAVERHLADCPACREAVRRESQLARSLSGGFEQAVGAATLDSAARRRMARAVERKIADSGEQPLLLFWRRLALPFAAIAMVLVVVVWMERHFVSGKNSLLVVERASIPDSNREMHIHFSYSVPGYTFRRNGNQVVDALTSETVVVDESFAEKNEKPKSGETYYEN
jgi:anti-sigma factor RsiW